MVGAIFELSDEKFGIVARLIVVRQSRCMQDTAFAAADDLVKSSRQRFHFTIVSSPEPYTTPFESSPQHQLIDPQGKSIVAPCTCQ